MKGWKLLAIAAGIGVANAVVYEIFEYVVNHGTDLVWNDWFGTDATRWLVVPTAVLLSILFSLVLRWLREPRWIEPHTSLELNQGSPESGRLSKLGKTLAVGASGLVAGGSLGPEMPLTEASQEVGSWVRRKTGVKDDMGFVLIAASIGALMVAFLGSMLMVLLAVLVVFQKARRVSLSALAVILVAGGASYGTLWLFTHNVTGFGDIPALPPADFPAYIGAVIVALCLSVAALVLVRLIGRLAHVTKRIDQHWPWYVSAGLWGLVLGGLYFVGGQPVQFGGSNGIPMLFEDSAQFGAWAFLGMAVVKLVATAWSKAAGYRGGLFFPAIFVGVALSLWLEALTPLSGPGMMVGAIAAIFAALSIPDKPNLGRREYLVAATIAFLMMAALLPAKLIPLAFVAIAAALFGNRLLVKDWRWH